MKGYIHARTLLAPKAQLQMSDNFMICFDYYYSQNAFLIVYV